MPGPPIEPDGPRAKRARGFPRKRWVTALAVLALLVAAATVRARIDGWTRSALEHAVRRHLGGELRLGRVEVRLWRLEIALADVELVVPPESALPLRFSMETGRARLAWSGMPTLAAGRVRLRELEAVRPELSFTGPYDAGPSRGGGDERRPFDLRVDRLAVREGRVTYADGGKALELEARDVLLRGAWEPEQNALVGRCSLGFSVLAPPMTRPYPLEVGGGFRVRRHDVEFVGIEARGEGLRLGLDANLRLVGGTGVVGRGELEGDLSRVAQVLGSDLPALAGEVRGGYEMEFGPGPLQLRGRLEAEHARFGPFEAQRVTTRVRYGSGKLELVELDTEALGGTVGGEVEVAIGKEPGFHVDLDGRGVELFDLFRALDIPLPISGRMDAGLRLDGVPGRVATWRGEGDFVTEPVGAAEGSVPAGGAGTVTIGDSRLNVGVEALDIARALLAVEVDVDLSTSPPAGTVQLSGVTRDARRTQQGVETILESLGAALPPTLRQELHGSGRVRASIGIGQEPRRLDLGLSLADGAFGRQRFDRAEVDLEGTLAAMALKRVHLVRGDQKVTGACRLTLDPFAVNALDLEAQGLDAQWLLDFAGIDTELSGRVDAAIRVDQTDSGRSGSGWAKVSEGRWLEESFDELRTDLEILPDRVRLNSLRIDGPALEATGSAVWYPADGQADLVLESARVRVGLLQAVQSREVDLGGGLDVQGEVGVSPDGVSGELYLKGEDWRLYGQPMGSFDGVAEIATNGLILSVAGSDEYGWNLSGTLGWEAELPVDATLRLDDTQIDLSPQASETSWARVTAEARVEGSLVDPEHLLVQGTVERTEIHRGVNSLRLVGPARFGFTGGRFEAEPLRWTGAGSDLAVRLRYDAGRDDLDATASGHVDLGLLAAVFPEVRASGRVDVDLRAAGPLERPKLAGGLEATEVRLRLLGFPYALERISFRAEAEGQRVSIRNLSARLGNGEISAEGEADLRGLALGTFEIRAAGANVTVRYPDGFRGVYEGQVVVRGTPDAPTISGRISMLRGLYDREFDLLRLLGVGTREYGGPGESPLPDNVLLDVNLVADGNVWLRNDMAEIESVFDLHVGGTLQRPQLTGRLRVLEGGEILFRDVQYRVLSGSLDFLDLERVNPYLTLRAESVVGDYTVFLSVEGTMDRFEYELTSDPSLSTQDIIALLTTGRTLEEITEKGTGTRGVTGDVAGNYFAGALAAPFERQLQKLLGLERVRINPMLIEGDAEPTTRITIGKEVADDIFVVVSTDVGRTERQIYEAEWRASHKFRLSVNHDTLGGIGGRVWYIDRFWWKKRQLGSVPDDVPMAAEPRPSEHAPVATVLIEGVSETEQAEIRRKIDLREGDEFSRSAMFSGVEAIKKFYVARDRIETRVDAQATSTESGEKIVYRIDVGPVIRVRFEGPKKKEERQLRSLLRQLWIESVFSEDLYDDSEARIREYYQEKGYFAVDAHLRVEVEDGERVLHCVVDRGKPVKVREVVLAGIENAAEESIRAQMLTGPPSLFSRRVLVPDVLDEDVAAIRRVLQEEGFLQASIAPPRIRLASTADSAVIELTITEGPRFTVARVEMPGGLPFSPEELSEWSGLKTGEVYAPSRLLEAESAIRVAMDERGYPDGRVRGRSELESSAVVVRFEVDPGSAKTVGAIRIVGNELTQEKVIRRALEFEVGDAISRANLLGTQHSLYQLGIFRNVKITTSPLEGGDREDQLVEISVEEAPPFSSRVGAGYDSEAGVGLNVSLGHDNVGGYDRPLHFQGKIDGLEQRLQVVGEEPRLFSRDLQALASVTWAVQDETGFTEASRGVAARVAKRLGPRWGTFIRYGFNRVDLSDVTISPDELQKERLVDGRFGDLGLAFVRDTRDDVLLPTRGKFLTAGVALFAKPLLSDFTFVKTTVTGTGVWSFGRGYSFFSSIRLGLAWPYGDDVAVPISAAFFAGGASTLRGFARDTVGPASGGEGLIIFNEDLRVPIWGSLKGVFFYDFGDVTERAHDLAPADFRHVLGTGLRFETPIGPLRLEYGHKVDREEGESAGELYLSIGLGF